MLEIFLSASARSSQLYLNRVYLSGGIYGVETMSQKMLRKPASQLTLGEAALIAGIIRAPASYSPWTHFDAARRRSFVVLQRMREEEKITAAQEQAARAERIQIQPPPSVSSARHGYAKEFLRQQFRNIYGGDNPPDWKVHTTFVPEIQDAAEIAVRDGLRRLGVAAVCRRRSSRSIRRRATCSRWSAARTSPSRRSTAPCAASGSRARRSSRSSMRRRSRAACRRSRRSPACSRSRCRRPRASGFRATSAPRGQDAMTLREALLESNNAAAVLLQQRVGTRPVLRLANDLGVDRTARRAVAGARQRPGHAARSDRRLRRVSQPRLPRAAARHRLGRERERQQRASGPHRARADPVGAGRVSDGDDAAGRRRRGTGRRRARAGRARRRSAARPGTTNEYRDAWFVGFNSSVVVGVWVGFDQPQKISRGRVGRARRAADLGRLHAAHGAAAAGRTVRRRPTICAARRSACCRITARSRAVRPTSSTSRTATTSRRGSARFTRAA